ncbi:hypothetical protein PEDI_32720 [Persicobacter diffluens]|uniref:Uncharacterized protein n=1 Tax=Persicobacter diffluens TaxID=981 RepID=A0AAN4W2F3_9BACT|nr:hypothetical protein PEDI_32720 [Persicobacter diffluens]
MNLRKVFFTEWGVFGLYEGFCKILILPALPYRAVFFNTLLEEKY